MSDNLNKVRLIYASDFFLVFHFDKDFVFDKKQFVQFSSYFFKGLNSDRIGKEEHIAIVQFHSNTHSMQLNKERDILTVDRNLHYSISNDFHHKILGVECGIPYLTLASVFERLDLIFRLNSSIFLNFRGLVINVVLPISYFTNKVDENYIIRRFLQACDIQINKGLKSYKNVWFLQDIIILLSSELGSVYTPTVHYKNLSYSLKDEIDELHAKYDSEGFYAKYTYGLADIYSIDKYVNDFASTILDIDFSVHTIRSDVDINDVELTIQDYADGFDNIFDTDLAKLMVFNNVGNSRPDNFIIVNAGKILAKRLCPTVNNNFMAGLLYCMSRMLSEGLHQKIYEDKSENRYRGYVENYFYFYWILDTYNKSDKFSVTLKSSKFDELLLGFKYAFCYALLLNRVVSSNYDIIDDNMSISLIEDRTGIKCVYYLV